MLKIKSFFKDESGQAMTEYGLIIALVAVALVAALLVFREAIADVFNNIGDSLNGTITP